MLNNNEAFSLVVIDTQLTDQGWNIQRLLGYVGRRGERPRVLDLDKRALAVKLYDETVGFCTLAPAGPFFEACHEGTELLI